MIREYHNGSVLQVRKKEPKKPLKTELNDRQTLHTIKIDTEMMNQIDFLTKYLQSTSKYTIYKIDVMRRVFEDELVRLDIFNDYKKSKKTFSKFGGKTQ